MRKNDRPIRQVDPLEPLTALDNGASNAYGRRAANRLAGWRANLNSFAAKHLTARQTLPAKPPLAGAVWRTADVRTLFAAVAYGA